MAWARMSLWMLRHVQYLQYLNDLNWQFNSFTKCFFFFSTALGDACLYDQFYFMWYAVILCSFTFTVYYLFYGCDISLLETDMY